MLKQRMITGAGMTCRIAVVLLLSGHFWCIKAVFAILSVMVAFELCRAGKYLQKTAFLLGTITAAVFFALFVSAELAGMVLLLALIGVRCLMPDVELYQGTGMDDPSCSCRKRLLKLNK